MRILFALMALGSVVFAAPVPKKAQKVPPVDVQLTIGEKPDEVKVLLKNTSASELVLPYRAVPLEVVDFTIQTEKGEAVRFHHPALLLSIHQKGEVVIAAKESKSLELRIFAGLFPDGRPAGKLRLTAVVKIGEDHHESKPLILE